MNYDRRKNKEMQYAVARNYMSMWNQYSSAEHIR